MVVELWVGERERRRGRDDDGGRGGGGGDGGCECRHGCNFWWEVVDDEEEKGCRGRGGEGEDSYVMEAKEASELIGGGEGGIEYVTALWRGIASYPF